MALALFISLLLNSGLTVRRGQIIDLPFIITWCRFEKRACGTCLTGNHERGVIFRRYLFDKDHS